MTKLKTKGLQITLSDGRKIVYYIYKGKTWTPTNCCVDHGEYYEIACYSHYKRIDKKTMQVTSDRRNVDKFEVEENVTAEIVKLEQE